ncbi:hypothetical protein O181_065656 [Austropuccinia psidii MF-1]|uniref:Uncharacterized protein n=1 Tax=Austropuccinia psidii MF-1 TaxID=1389203 RepID=A0A9Q3I1E5_9BASI|nr:hypothetical protein [Austropuccinia psidii MF-1]
MFWWYLDYTIGLWYFGCHACALVLNHRLTLSLLLYWEDAIPPYWEASSKHQEVFMEQRDVARWTDVGGPIPVGGRPIYSSSEVPISRINTEGIVQIIRQIANSPPYLDAEGSDELDGEDVEVLPNSPGHPSNNSLSQPPAKRFQTQIIPSTPENSNPLLLPFLLPFLLLNHTLPTPGLP